MLLLVLTLAGDAALAQDWNLDNQQVTDPSGSVVGRVQGERIVGSNGLVLGTMRGGKLYDVYGRQRGQASSGGGSSAEGLAPALSQPAGGVGGATARRQNSAPATSEQEAAEDQAGGEYYRLEGTRVKDPDGQVVALFFKNQFLDYWGQAFAWLRDQRIEDASGRLLGLMKARGYIKIVHLNDWQYLRVFDRPHLAKMQARIQAAKQPKRRNPDYLDELLEKEDLKEEGEDPTDPLARYLIPPEDKKDLRGLLNPGTEGEENLPPLLRPTQGLPASENIIPRGAAEAGEVPAEAVGLEKEQLEHQPAPAKEPEPNKKPNPLFEGLPGYESESTPSQE